MANSSINIDNYAPAAVKNTNEVVSKVVSNSSRTADTWFTVCSKTFTVHNASAKVEINIAFTECFNAVATFFRLLRDGSQISAFTPASPSARTTVTQGSCRSTSSTGQNAQAFYYVDTGLSAGAYTYSIQTLADTTGTVPLNRNVTESATTSRSILLIDIAEL